MDFWSIFWSVVTALIAYVIGEMVINRPKITIPISDGWTESKQINTYTTKEFSTDTDSRVEKELKTRDYYNFHGIGIRNEKWVISGVNATISKITIRIWDANETPVTGWYEGRLWGGRKNASNDPLFPKEKVNPNKTIGVGEDIDIVLAYNQENELSYYKFTIETHLDDHFMTPKDLLTQQMPLYGVIRLHGHRITNNLIFFVVTKDEKRGSLNIKVLPEKQFPLSREALVET